MLGGVDAAVRSAIQEPDGLAFQDTKPVMTIQANASNLHLFQQPILATPRTYYKRQKPARRQQSQLDFP